MAAWAGGVLALGGCQNLTEHHFIHVRCIDAGLFQGRLHDDGAKIMGRNIGKRTIEGPDGCAGRADNDDIGGSAHHTLQDLRPIGLSRLVPLGHL